MKMLFIQYVQKHCIFRCENFFSVVATILGLCIKRKNKTRPTEPLSKSTSHLHAALHRYFHASLTGKEIALRDRSLAADFPRNILALFSGTGGARCDWNLLAPSKPGGRFGGRGVEAAQEGIEDALLLLPVLRALLSISGLADVLVDGRALLVGDHRALFLLRCGADLLLRRLALGLLYRFALLPGKGKNNAIVTF